MNYFFVSGNKNKLFKSQNKFTQIKTLFYNIIGIILLLIGRSFYIKSLNGCNGDEFKCVVMNKKYIFDGIHFCLKSILYFLIFLLFLHLNFFSKYLLIIFLLTILEFILKDTGDSFLHHGILNLSALFFSLILGEILILSFIFIINIKNKKIVFLIFIKLELLLIIFYNKNKDNYLCTNWNRGLNDSFISNNKSIYPCSIIIPKNKCLIDIVSPLFDISRILNIDCRNRKEKEKYLLKSLSNLNKFKEIKKIAFPITTIEKDELKGKSPLYSDKLMKYVLNNLINLDDKNMLNNLKKGKQPEIFIDFTENPYGELKQKINFNEKLSEERLKSGEKIYSNNILFLFFDNLSRQHFYRQYKKTSNFIKKFLSFNGFSTENNPNQRYHGFEFLKYHKFQLSTIYNVIPMFSGVYFNQKNRMISIVKDMKKVGYVTCNVQDVCHKELMKVGNIKKYSYIEFDHEYSAPSCDPNVNKRGWGLFSGENGILRRCLYGKESIEHALEYGKNFWKIYKKNKKFLRISNSYGHEYSGEKSKYADDAYFNFLLELYVSEQLHNTTIFLVGDHGNMVMGVYKLFEPNDLKLEQFFPILIIITSDIKNTSFQEQYSEIMKNQQTLVTPFDVYYTLREIIYGRSYKDKLMKEQINNGESLFKYINPMERTCKKYKHMKKCRCKSYR